MKTDAPAPIARYNAVAMGLHWLIAAMLITNIAFAWYFNTLTGLPKIPPTQIHKSIGITILLLSLVRLGWRLFKPPPPLPPSVVGWERWAARLTYALFYVVMIGMPLSGWALSSASKYIKMFPITLFGLATWPAIAPLTNLPDPQMHQAHEAFASVHGLLAKLAYVLIVVHVLAALRHQFIRRDDVLARMLPFLRARRT